MDMTMIPPWMSNLDDEDMTFIKRFLLASGSMKEVAAAVRRLLPHRSASARPAHPENPVGRADRERAVYRAHQTARGR